MKAIREDQDGYEVVYHGVSQFDYERLLAEAGDNPTKITLYGRVGDEFEFEEVQGKGFVYATSYEERENATPGASSHGRGALLALGYNGYGSEEIIAKPGEYLVPLSSYKVLGVVEGE